MNGEEFDEYEMAEGRRFDGRIDADTFLWTGDNGGAMETFLGPWFNSLIPSEGAIELNIGRDTRVRYSVGAEFHIRRREATGIFPDMLEVTRQTDFSEQVEAYGDPNYVNFVTDYERPKTVDLPPAPLTAEGRRWAQTVWERARAAEAVRTDAAASGGWEGAGALTPETEAVWAEYSRAKAKHGDHVIDGPVYTDHERYVVLMEEVGEVAHELTYDADRADGGDGALYDELIQVATMALGFAKAIRERRRTLAEAEAAGD